MEIVAELGASHNQDYETALALVFAAQESGADTIKVQMFTPDQMALNDGSIITEGPWAEYDLYHLYEKAAMSIEFVPKLKKLCEQVKMGFIASVYHPDMVKVAEEIGIERYKIASFELPWLGLVKTVAATEKPMIMSGGMAEHKEISAAVQIAKKHCKDLTLLWCVNDYPADPEKMDLKTLTKLRKFHCKSGLSDHSTGYIAPVVAMVLGAAMLEKHIKIDGGLDESFALTPVEFKAMVDIVRAAENSIGSTRYGGKKKFRRKEVEGKWVRTC